MSCEYFSTKPNSACFLYPLNIPSSFVLLSKYHEYLNIIITEPCKGSSSGCGVSCGVSCGVDLAGFGLSYFITATGVLCNNV